MTRKFALQLIVLAVLVCALLSTAVYAEIVVGVKDDDWIEYSLTGTGNVPAEHNVTEAKIEILGVDETEIDIQISPNILMEEKKP